MTISNASAMLADWEAWIHTGPTNISQTTPSSRALLIAYEFPPVGGSGVQRPVKLAKYLREFGWSLDVITADHKRFPWQDDTLLNDLSPHSTIYRIRGFEPACLALWASYLSRSLSPASRKWIEDRVYWRLTSLTRLLGRGNGEGGWMPSGLRAALQLQHANPYDAVISTGPPNVAHKIARKLSALARIPWVCDMRDPLLSDFDRAQRPTRRERRAQQLEQLVMQDARAVIATTSALAHDLQKRYPQRAPAIRCITNGFDRSDLLLQESLARSTVRNDECLLLASGSFYGRRELAKIIESLERTLHAHPDWLGRVRLMVAGTIDAEQKRRIEKSIPACVTLHGYVDHPRSIELAMRAACSIVIVPDCRHGRLSIPAKTFELLALPRHVLGLVPVGSEAEIVLQRAGACTLAAFENEHEIDDALERIISDHFAGTLAHGRNWSALDIYDRRTTARDFAGVLDRICGITRKYTSSSQQIAQEVERVLARLPVAPSQPITQPDGIDDEITLEIQ